MCTCIDSNFLLASLLSSFSFLPLLLLFPHSRYPPPPPIHKPKDMKDTYQMVAIKAETLNLGQELGQGEFGSVLRGTYRAPDGKLVSTLYIGNPAPRSSTCPIFNFALCKCGGGGGKVFDTFFTWFMLHVLYVHGGRTPQFRKPTYTPLHHLHIQERIRTGD